MMRVVMVMTVVVGVVVRHGADVII